MHDLSSQPTDSELHYIVIAYLIAAVPSACWCVRQSARHHVESTFTPRGLLRILGEAMLSPIAIVIAVPFAIAFWPLLCLMDLSEIPKKKRLQQQASESDLAERMRLEPVANELEQEQLIIGQLGETLGAPSPMGKIRIGDTVRNASSRSGYIENGKQVVVIGLHESTLEVELVKAE